MMAESPSSLLKSYFSKMPYLATLYYEKLSFSSACYCF